MTPAMRAKISRAVKASFRRRRAGGGSIARRRTTIIRTRPVRRRRSIMRFTSAPRRVNRIRRRQGIVGGGGGMIGQLINARTLSIAGGAIGASFLTTFILSRFGAQLPLFIDRATGRPSMLGSFIYKLSIPGLGAFLIRRQNRDIATGMLVGGVIMVANDLISMMNAPRVAAAPTAALRGYSDNEDYGGEADFASQSFMQDPDMLGAEELAGMGQDEELGEYFDAAEFQTDPLYQSQPAFQTSFN
jgi:hypothetical protein